MGKGNMPPWWHRPITTRITSSNMDMAHTQQHGYGTHMKRVLPSNQSRAVQQQPTNSSTVIQVAYCSSGG
jgi:hypothetical protein